MEIFIGGRVRVLNMIRQELKYVDSEEGKIVELEQMIQGSKLEYPCIIFLQDKRRVY